jgi:hypothetical protein
MEETIEKLICEHCGKECDIDDVYFMGDEPYCMDCIDELTTICSECGKRVWNDDNYGDSETPLCDSCYNSSYTTCSSCGRTIHYDAVRYTDEDDDISLCEECYEKEKSKVCINEYSYKPTAIFYGENNRYFGVELEIDGGGKSNNNAKEILEVANNECENIYIKSDGSLDCGLEIVTHPMTLDYHIQQMPWKRVANKALNLDYYSHKTDTCGLHVHINRECFGDLEEIQEVNISRFLYFIENHWNELLRFSRRTESEIKRWAARYGRKDTPKEVMDNAKYSNIGRYACVNLTNRSTIEVRIFKGTLKYNTIIATLQMVNAICDAAIFMSDERMAELSWCEFVSELDQEKVPELIRYLKERRLYINEPIDILEEE